uniref:Uncharacterized protein n=1 Tax=Aegilops tauschii TaxID=37682 RepID=M8CBT3_AEGTA
MKKLDGWCHPVVMTSAGWRSQMISAGDLSSSAIAGEDGRDCGGELKVAVSMVTGLEPREQRLLFRGKEREDSDHLHMVGVRDKDKVLLLEDPALKDIKLRSALAGQAVQSPYRTFIEV